MIPIFFLWHCKETFDANDTQPIRKDLNTLTLCRCVCPDRLTVAIARVKEAHVQDKIGKFEQPILF